jgi:hypothetical protein
MAEIIIQIGIDINARLAHSVIKTKKYAKLNIIYNIEIIVTKAKS